MNIQLKAKRALVTASTGGIGFAVVKGLAEAGAAVVINGRSERSVNEAVVRLLLAVPDASVSGVAADLSTAEGVATLLAGVSDIDILVNNAGIYGPQDFFETGDDVWDRYWHTNVMSGVRLSRALLPAMVARGWGRVVFVASLRRSSSRISSSAARLATSATIAASFAEQSGGNSTSWHSSPAIDSV